MRLFANDNVSIFDLSLYAFRNGIWASFVIGVPNELVYIKRANTLVILSALCTF